MKKLNCQSEKVSKTYHTNNTMAYSSTPSLSITTGADSIISSLPTVALTTEEEFTLQKSKYRYHHSKLKKTLDTNTINTENNNAAPITRMPNQVGGHFSENSMLITPDKKYVLKQIQQTKKDNRGIREVAFYEAMAMVKEPLMISEENDCKIMIDTVGENTTFDSDSYDTIMTIFNSCVNRKTNNERRKKEVKILQNLSRYTSPYYGTFSYFFNNHDRKNQQSSSSSYIILQNILTIVDSNHHQYNNIMDIKMGTQTFEPTAPEKKKMSELNKYPYQSVFGFRIIGMLITGSFYRNNNKNIMYDKAYGRSLDTDQKLLDAFRIFFHASSSINTNSNDGTALTSYKQGIDQGRIDTTSAMKNLIDKLVMLKRDLEEINQGYFHFYSSSLLIAHDIIHNNITVKMIDFCHVLVEDCKTTDQSGYLYGLQNLIKYFSILLIEDEDAIKTKRKIT